MLIKKNILEELIKSQGNPFDGDTGTPTVDHTEIERLEQFEKELLGIAETIEKEREKLEQNKKAFENDKELSIESIREQQKNLTDQLIELEKTQANLVQHSKKDLLEIATKLTEELLQREVLQDPNTIARVTDQALDEMKLNPNQIVKLRLKANPVDKEAAEQHLKHIESNRAGQIEMKLVLDEGVTRGSCILEGDQGTINLDFNSQIALFKKKMLGGN